MNIKHNNFDIYLSDNSENKNYHRNIHRRFGLECGHVESRNRNIFEVITDSFNQIRTRVLYGGYSHFLSIEQDIEVLPDILNYFLSWEKDFISAMYFVGLNEGSVLS